MTTKYKKNNKNVMKLYKKNKEKNKNAKKYVNQLKLMLIVE